MDNVTSYLDLPIRDNLRGLTPYGAPQNPAAIQLNVNENSYGYPAEVAESIAQALKEVVANLNRYPDREFTELRTELAAYLGPEISPEQIWAANGSNEVIQHIFQAFGGPGRKVLSFTPTYSMYSLIASGTETEWIAVPRESDYTIDESKALTALAEHKATMTIICSPNNPTGTPVSLELIDQIYQHTEGLVIVDEAYAEFGADKYQSAVNLLAGRPRLIVLKTLSKAFAFAGARLGYLVADPAVSDAIRLVRLPYHLSALTQAAAVAALRHAKEMLGTVELLKIQRDRIIAGLEQLGYQPYPSATNFVFFSGVKDPNRVFNELLARGILIRDVGIPGSLRVTAGTAEESDKFLAALAEIEN